VFLRHTGPRRNPHMASLFLGTNRNKRSIILDIKVPEARDALLEELRLGRGADRRLDAALEEAERRLATPDEAGARRLVESLGLALQGSLLVRHSPGAVADAFCATRLVGDGGYAFGTLPAGVDACAILSRTWPQAVAR